MILSLFTLTVNASRAFFIQRGKDEADPAPSPHMILKVFPYMLIQVKGTTKTKPEDLESNQVKEKPDQPVIVQTKAGWQKEGPVESKFEPPAGQRHDQTETEISTETQPKEGGTDRGVNG